MSWAHLSGRDVVQDRSSVETKSLGLSTARVEVPLHSEAGAESVRDAVLGMGAELTVVRSPADRVQLQGELTEYLPQHVVLHADTLMYWQLTVTPEHSRGGESAPKSALDPAVVERLVLDVFDGYQNHYSSNPRLRSVNVGRAYASWAASHVNSGQPYCYLEIEGQSAAVATLAVESSHLEVLLAGVVSDLRGRGAYRELLQAIESEARHWQVESVVISTQAQNIAVQRSWARFGFVPLAAFDTLHVMQRSDV